LEPTSLVTVCAIALASVFALLAFLAGVMQIITVVFSARSRAIDPAVVAAVSTTVSVAMPGARVTHIEEG
jgi:hypothetical protein